MLTTTNHRVLIIGAGPGGLTAAIALARAGIEAEVFERVQQMREIGAGLGLQTNAIRALLQIGVGEPMLERGVSVNQETYSDGGQLLMRLPYHDVAVEHGDPGVIILSRTDVQDELLREVDRGRIHLGAECLGVEQDEGGATAEFADGRRESGALVIGADGLRSAVRAQIHSRIAPRYSGFTSWRGISPSDPSLLPEHVFRLYIGPGVQFAIFPLRDAIYWSGTLVAPEGGHKDPADELADCLRHFGHFPEPAEALMSSTPAEEITRTDIYDRDPVRPWSKGRVVLIGDAAHPTTPFMGQGASMAIEDAVALTRELSVTRPLINPSSLKLALCRYELGRADRANSTVLQSRGIGESYKLTDPAEINERNERMRMTPQSELRNVCEESLEYHV
jgi:2-polyprenyl-6-methoxyphenol hydroxylase-like FAD-dependent oxidoreductase